MRTGILRLLLLRQGFQRKAPIMSCSESLKEICFLDPPRGLGGSFCTEASALVSTCAPRPARSAVQG